MEGLILHFDENSRQGIVRNHNGERFSFTISDWRGSTIPRTGQKVDFLTSGNVATDIYNVKSADLANIAAEKIVMLRDSGYTRKVSALFTGGIHNIFGVVATIAVMASLFFPLINIPILGSVSMINDSDGKLLFIMLSVLAVFFYGGATRLYTQILSAAALGFLFIQYYGLYSDLNDVNNFFSAFNRKGQTPPNMFKLIQWGTFVNITAALILGLANVVGGYKKNDKAI